MTPEPAAPAPDPPRSAVHVRAAQIVLIEDPQGLGTGILVGPDGLVLTNKHVAPSLGPYRVILADGKDLRGVGVHQDPHHDLAVVKIAASPASFLDVGTDVADEYVVGEEVFALGHPRGCRFSVARGIISNPHREFEKEYYVQTDVSINPGNSGGPLVDRQGRLIGVVTMILSNSQGLGFAVPGHIAADYVRHVRRLLRANVVRIPEELFAHPDPPRDDAREVVRRAIGALVAAGRTSIKDEKPDLGTHTLEHKSATVEVAVQEGMFTVRAQLSALGPGERQNAPFLCRLLELSSSQDVGGASFTLRDGALQAVVARRAASLDLEEATWAIDLIAHTAAAAPAKVASLLFGSAQPTPAGAALAAAPPAPPVAPAPPAPPPGAPQAPWPPPPYAAPPPSPAAPNPLGPAVFGPPAYGQPPPPQPPYGAPPGYAPPGYGYGAPPMPPPPGYGAPPMPPPPGYGAPPGAPPPAYGAPPGLPPAPGYGAPPGAPPAYGAPPMPPAPGYGAPPPAAPPAPPADPGYPIIQPPPPAGWK